MAILTATPRGTDPAWCSGHYEPSAREAFHQHTFDRSWGASDEKVRLGLTRFDHNGRAGEARIEVQYLTEVTDVQGSASLTDREAREMTGDVLFTLAMKTSASRSGPALVIRCAYEAGRAFVAAVRSARASSPRTDSRRNRSISSW